MGFQTGRDPCPGSLEAIYCLNEGGKLCSDVCYSNVT